ncbi:hypothetical protein F4801DRAFT_605111 [Xylaria longipes]|nr:hypothetical protein F4801DRAFT_605111 [Xylaria longipes]
MSRFKYEFWHCGHITKISDGSILVENGNIEQLPKWLYDRDQILRRFGDDCPRCYTERVLQRLRSLRFLILKCNGQHEAVKMALRRITALTEYVSLNPSSRFLAEEGSLNHYPPEFLVMMSHVIELGIEVHTSACEDFAAAYGHICSRDRLQFVDRINAIRDNAQICFTVGSSVEKECMAQIVAEADDMVREIKEYDAEELLLLQDLDAKAVTMKRLLDEYFESNKRYYESLQRPKF